MNVRRHSCTSTGRTASRTSPSAATRHMSFRRAAARFSRTGSSAALRSSPETRSATRPSVASSWPSSFAWPAPRAGAWRSPARRARRFGDYAALGFKSFYLGDEAVIRPSEFTLDGRAIRKVRQSVSRLEKSGFTVRVLSVARRRRCAAQRARVSVARVARQLAGTRLHDGDGCTLRVSGHRARRRRRPDGRRRRVLATRPLAGERGLLARVDASQARHAERV